MGRHIIAMSLALLLCAPFLPLPGLDRDCGWVIDVGNFHLLSMALHTSTSSFPGVHMTTHCSYIAHPHYLNNLIIDYH